MSEYRPKYDLPEEVCDLVEEVSGIDICELYIPDDVPPVPDCPVV